MRIASRTRSALCREVVDLVRPHLLDDADEVGGVREVAVVELEAHVPLVRVAVQVVDAVGIEQRRAALDAVYLVALLEQQFSEIGPVLAGDARDECGLGGHSCPFGIVVDSQSVERSAPSGNPIRSVSPTTIGPGGAPVALPRRADQRR